MFSRVIYHNNKKYKKKLRMKKIKIAKINKNNKQGFLKFYDF